MQKNMGKTDVRMRIVAAAIIALLYAFNIISGVAAIVLLGLAAVFLITSMFSFCPLYALFGLSTCRARKPLP
jgi:hypothetical protein